MNFTDKEKLVNRIASARVYGSIFYKGQDVDFFINDPSIYIRTRSDLVYEKVFKETKAVAFDLEESFQMLRESGEWSDGKEKELESIEKTISDLEAQLPTIRFLKEKERNTIKAIQEFKKRKEQLFSTKYKLYQFTAEHMAEKAKRLFLIEKCMCKRYRKLTLEKTFLDKVCIFYYQDSDISIADIREIARTDPWRVYWTISKETGTPLFPRSSVEMTHYQYLLCLWSRIYDSAYESNNCPTDDVIANDAKFDAWYKSQVAQRQQEQLGQATNMYSTSQETGIMADAEGAKEVYALNNPMVRKDLKKRFDYVETKGEVAEQNLPDVRQKIQMQANQMESKETMERARINQ